MRDKRVTTHCALVSRAMGAQKIIITGDKDEGIERNLESVSERFGGDFSVEHAQSYREILKSFRGTKVHLTMYGLALDTIMPKIQTRDLLVVIGGEKVPADVYDLVDYNISVTNQPHSEIAALALLLDRYYDGKELSFSFPDSKLEIIPSKKGKQVRKSRRNLNKE
jgi:tRNA (cytidine56-2'-O)-methyltransferase